MTINPIQNDSRLLPSISDDEKLENLCNSLMAIHGQGHVRREKSGRHLYLPCPLCRQNYGHNRERRSKHLAINLDLYCSPERLTQRSKSGKGMRGYAKCMKCDAVFTVEDLMRYPEQPDAGGGRRFDIKSVGDRYLVKDDNGHMIPDHPGRVVPVKGLSRDHPAVQYLESRDYDIDLLTAQFRVAYCEEEAPTGEQYGNRFYRTHSDGFRSTPQGRIIFYADVVGVQNCWQARYIEMKENLEDGTKRTWIWHPYRRIWVPEPVWDDRGGLIKYLTAPGSLRNQTLGGYDHVTAYCRHSGDDFCVLTEGPPDAARFPHHGLALFGKSVSDIQCVLLQRFFKRVVLGFDTDKPGRTACKNAEEILGRYGIQTRRFFPGDEPSESKHDIGEMGYTKAAERLNQVLSTF